MWVTLLWGRHLQRVFDPSTVLTPPLNLAPAFGRGAHPLRLFRTKVASGVGEGKVEQCRPACCPKAFCLVSCGVGVQVTCVPIFRARAGSQELGKDSCPPIPGGTCARARALPW